jgi:hypothetical protein
MPGWTASAANSGAEAVRTRISHVSLHTADSATGANEVSGGGYARVARTSSGFTAAAGGTISPTADVTFAGPASGACTHFGLWDGSTFLGMGAITTGDTAFNAEGVFLLQAGTVAGFALHAA